MAFKFEKLEVWNEALDYSDRVESIARSLPSLERFNLADQLRRAATSIALNIAEGSTGQSDAEQSRFLSYAIRSLIETVACLHLIRRRGYLEDLETLREAYAHAERLLRQLTAFRRSLGGRFRDPSVPYDSGPPE
ncbi:four helix bundle protein [Rubrivirga sp. IMCC45206]|uniref:four helix bundle protein n=1 Tax=Rubrivirga sp. IMCC45206 TaxID=3391614 RepID=UPI0039903A04